jgi:ribosomal protein S1
VKLLGDDNVWDELKNRCAIGNTVAVFVFCIAPFGVFIELGEGAVGLLRVPEMAGDHRKAITDYPQVGETVTAKVIWHDDRNRQVVLTQRH